MTGQKLIPFIAAIGAACHALAADIAVQPPPALPGSYSGGKPHGCQMPQFPREAARYELQGKTIVEVLIDDDGQLQGKRISESSGWTLLDRAALSNVSTCRFSPVTRDGKPAGATWKPVAFVWTLKGAGQRGTRPVLLPGSCAESSRLAMTDSPSGNKGVLLRFLTSPLGGAYGIKVERSSGDAAIDADAVRAVEACSYTPSLSPDIGLPRPGSAFAWYLLENAP